jgi:hypothetical protein
MAGSRDGVFGAFLFLFAACAIVSPVMITSPKSQICRQQGRYFPFSRRGCHCPPALSLRTQES